jgi:hypothetical protein
MQLQISQRSYLKYTALLFLSMFLCVKLSSQTLSPLNHHHLQQIEQHINKKGIYSASKPLDLTKLQDHFNVDSIILKEKFNYDKSQPWLKRKLFYESAIIVNEEDFNLFIDPVFNFQGSLDASQNDFLLNNTRGIQVKGNIGKGLYFITDFYENQSFFPAYINNFVSDYTIAPAQGIVKPFKESGYDYAYASGLVSYSPNDLFNFQFGHGKNVVGNGYRSMLLSDNTFNYPFLKITTTTPWFQYTNLFASFLDLNLNQQYFGGFQRKYGSFHFINFSFEKLEIGLFQATVWEVKDSIQKGGFEIQYLNPIILYEPLVHGLREPNNSLLGLNLRIIPFANFHIYGQLVLDDMDLSSGSPFSDYVLNKTTYQAGIKWFDLLSVNKLYFHLEFNSADPYMYSSTTPIQNYAHYQQPLAHPLGANFREFINIVNYRYKNILLQVKTNFAVYGSDNSDTHWGKNIFESDYYAERGYPGINNIATKNGLGNETTQGIKTRLIYFNPEISYILNPNTNMQISAGIVKRQLKSDLEEDDLLLLYLSFKTALTNIYYDF